MEFISKYDKSFIKNVNRKYNKKFKSFDEYSLFLYELTPDEEDCWVELGKKEENYYIKLEEDLKEYCDYQTERKYGNGKSKS